MSVSAYSPLPGPGKKNVSQRTCASVRCGNVEGKEGGGVSDFIMARQRGESELR